MSPLSFRKIVLCLVLLIFTSPPLFAPKLGSEEEGEFTSHPNSLRQAILQTDREDHPGNSVFKIVAGIPLILYNNPEFLPVENIDFIHNLGYGAGAYLIMDGTYLFCK